MKLLLFFIILLLTVLGLCEFLHIIRLLFIFPKREMHTRLFIELKEKIALKQITFAGEQLSWLGSKYADEIIAVGDNLTDETFFECEGLSKKYGIKIICETCQ